MQPLPYRDIGFPLVIEGVDRTSLQRQFIVVLLPTVTAERHAVDILVYATVHIEIEVVVAGTQYGANAVAPGELAFSEDARVPLINTITAHRPQAALALCLVKPHFIDIIIAELGAVTVCHRHPTEIQVLFVRGFTAVYPAIVALFKLVTIGLVVEKIGEVGPQVQGVAYRVCGDIPVGVLPLSGHAVAPRLAAQRLVNRTELVNGAVCNCTQGNLVRAVPFVIVGHCAHTGLTIAQRLHILQ